MFDVLPNLIEPLPLVVIVIYLMYRLYKGLRDTFIYHLEKYTSKKHEKVTYL